MGDNIVAYESVGVAVSESGNAVGAPKLDPLRSASGVPAHLTLHLTGLLDEFRVLNSQSNLLHKL